MRIIRHSNGFIILDIIPEDLMNDTLDYYHEYAFITVRKSEVALHIIHKNYISIGFYDYKANVYFACRYL